VIASLATVTTREFGAEREPDPSKPSRIEAEIDHHPTWVVTFRSVPERVVSGSFAGGPQPNPADHLGTVVVFISPMTGSFIYGLAF